MDADVYEGVRDYYDRNTKEFKTHASAVADAVHRGVYAPGVASDEAAFSYVNQRILQHVTPPARLLDLGCGIGGTAFYLSQHADVNVTGVTLSPVQADHARQRAASLGLETKCKFEVASYLELPPLPPCDLAYAIESFVHGPDAGRFFLSAAGALVPRGKLVICDDLLTERGAAALRADSKQARYIHDFRWGWHAHTTITVATAQTLAEAAGLRMLASDDLTPHLKLGTPHDRWIAFWVALGHRLPLRSAWWRSWVGGNGIQRCLLDGLAEYRLLVFQK